MNNKKRYKTISFSKLSCEYFPKQEKRNAVRSLSRWIERNKSLKMELAIEGFKRYNHQILTPLQHELIVIHLGEPFVED